MVWCGMAGTIRLDKTWYGSVCSGRQRKVARGSLGRFRHGRRGWFGAIWLGPVGFFRQARSDLVLRVQVGLGVVQRGRLGEVGIGVVCKVLSGRLGRAGYGRIGFGVI